MRKLLNTNTKFAILLSFIFALFAVNLFAQDSTAVGDAGAAASEILSIVWGFLTSKYPALTPFTFIVTIILAVIKKAIDKKKIAAQVKEIITSAKPGEIAPEHENALLRLIHRLEGKKKEKSTTK